MGILSGLEKFGFDKKEAKSIFDEGSVSSAAPEKVKEQQGQPAAEEPQAPAHTEDEFLLAKTVHCPVCDESFRSRMVKTGRVKRLEPDFDLRPRFAYIDTNKYDVSSCPKCGYTAMNRYFDHLSKGQIKMLEQEVRSKFKPKEGAKAEEKAEPYTYEEAIGRYKLALYCTMVKKGSTSEKAYECLKLAWLYRGLCEEMEASGETEGEAYSNAKQEEAMYYDQAYEGFIKAIASENFPMCGMDENTVNILLANMAYRLGKYDVASKLVSTVLTSRVAPRTVKDRAMLLKEEIVQTLHNTK